MEKTPHVCCRPSNRQDTREWHSRHRDAPVLANRALKTARFCFGEVFPERVNPFLKVTLFPERSRSRRLTDDERDRWLTALFALRAEGALPEITCDALYVLRFTAARKNEILKLRREQIDLQAKVALIEDHKTDDTDSTRTIQLEQVIDVITRRVAACERDADIGTTAKYAKCGRDTARRAAVRTAEKMGVRPW